MVYVLNLVYSAIRCIGCFGCIGCGGCGGCGGCSNCFDGFSGTTDTTGTIITYEYWLHLSCYLPGSKTLKKFSESKVADYP